MAMRGASSVTYEDQSVTGSKLQILESLKRTCAAYCREGSNVKKMYIGIGSGSSPKSAMQRRYDDYKSDEGINHMVAIYSSSSQDNVREVEDALCEYFSEHLRNINRTGGGGGRDSSGPSFYVYLAMRRWG